MRVVILSDATCVAKFAADEICTAVQSQPRLKLGLATGGTPLGVYRELIQRYDSREVSFAEVITFNLDEYVGLGPDHPSSYRHYMNERLFEKIDIRIRNTFVPRGDAEDFDDESLRYERLIVDAGGIDLQMLGIGSDGHIGFNEPGSSLASRTRVKTLTTKTRNDNARYFESIDVVPKSSLTMGIATILEAKSILLLACGAGKASAVSNALEGPITSFVPASSLQMHPCVTLVVDEAAASFLKNQEYYRQSEAERLRLASQRPVVPKVFANNPLENGNE